MAQITIYLDSEIAEKARIAAKSSRMSVSRWISQLISERTSKTWPEAVRDMAGAWSDFPTAEEIRKGLGTDVRREDF